MFFEETSMLDSNAYAQMMARIEPLIAEGLTRDVGDVQVPIGTGKLAKAIPQNAVLVGILPERLRGLYCLQKELEAAAKAECHRRCVTALGTEAYDDDHVEFQVYCSVTNDPQFAGEAVVGYRLCEEIEKVFPVTSGTKRYLRVLFVDENWNLYLIGVVDNMRIDNTTCPTFA
jgi:hypothetical protein